MTSLKLEMIMDTWMWPEYATAEESQQCDDLLNAINLGRRFYHNNKVVKITKYIHVTTLASIDIKGTIEYD